ncbi:hypothetical protein [Kushneria phyllosphaerae]|uniref:Uncharacterized protein n=1 Tax=Kushneria phyllosphaerae TaxID=2100822 RepID=A0A2R8CKV8_9GAMM|nr:hypothetical protein [Kushneria phyllosphaerae]SPJ33452.1 hypothetical protein KSP9073_01461 [Kushneria phyllosphaerae]
MFWLKSLFSINSMGKSFQVILALLGAIFTWKWAAPYIDANAPQHLFFTVCYLAIWWAFAFIVIAFFKAIARASNGVAREYILEKQADSFLEKEAEHLQGMIAFLGEEEKALVFRVYEEGPIKMPTLSQPVHRLIQNGFLLKKYSVNEDFLVCQMTKAGRQAVHRFKKFA